MSIRSIGTAFEIEGDFRGTPWAAPQHFWAAMPILYPNAAVSTGEIDVFPVVLGFQGEVKKSIPR